MDAKIGPSPIVLKPFIAAAIDPGCLTNAVIQEVIVCNHRFLGVYYNKAILAIIFTDIILNFIFNAYINY